MVKWCWKFSRTLKTGIGVLGLSWLVMPFVGAAAEDVEVAPPPKRPTAMQPVGNYAYSIHFSDGHNSGIYTLDYLRHLGAGS